MTDSLISDFSQLSTNDVSDLAVSSKALKAIMCSESLSRENRRDCVQVFEKWITMSNEVLCKDLVVLRQTDISNLLRCMKKFNHKEYIRSLTVHDRPNSESTRWISRLLNKLSNVEELVLAHMNPYFVLRVMQNMNVRRLKSIDISWENCQGSDAVKNWFYAANYHHRKTITDLRMPVDEREKIRFFYRNKYLKFSREAYLENFSNLEYLADEEE